MNREQALALVNEYTKNQNLVKHMLAVEACMAAYAKKFGENEEEWRVAGLVHDFDYEKMGDQHPSQWGYDLLREKGASEDVIQAIVGHADRENPASRPTLMAKALFACDELTGLVVACSLPRPNQISDLELSSVKKKFKDISFARGVNRDDVIRGAQELGMELDDHIQFVIDAMREVKGELGLK